MPHVHEDELEAWANVSRGARSHLLKVQTILKKVEQALLVIDQQATAAQEPTLLDRHEDELAEAVKEVEREAS